MKFEQAIAPVVGKFSPRDAPSYNLLAHCMRCGLCLAARLTYSLDQQERGSLRRRLSLMRAVSEGHLRVTDGFTDAMTLCLGCLAGWGSLRTPPGRGSPTGRGSPKAEALPTSRDSSKMDRRKACL